MGALFKFIVGTSSCKHKEAGEFLSVACESVWGGGNRKGGMLSRRLWSRLVQKFQEKWLEIGSILMTNVY